MKRLLKTLMLIATLFNPLIVFADSLSPYELVSRTPDTMVKTNVESGKTIYYYYGKDIDNYAIIGNQCFRMMRTTTTEGVKMIHYGEAENGKCLTMGSGLSYTRGYSDNTYSGYMISDTNQTTYELTHANKYDSPSKTNIDNWFKDNMLDYMEYLEDTIYCNDRSVYPEDGSELDGNVYYNAYGYNFYSTGIGADPTLYAAIMRLTYGTTPTLECKQNNDKFTVSSEIGNGKLTYPVGFLSADEYAMSLDNLETYIPSTAVITPMEYTIVSGDGLSMYENSSNIIRPVVSVGSNTIIKSGDGSQEDPYVIGIPKTEEPKEEVKEETPVKNPKTGIINYVIVFLILESIIILPYLYMRRKTMFK